MKSLEELKNKVNDYNKLTERQFLLLFISLLKENNIEEINQEEIINKLCFYKKEEKFKELFNNIKEEKYRDTLDLGDGFYTLKTEGYLLELPNRNISKINEQKQIPLNAYYKKSTILRMEFLVKRYLIEQNLEEKLGKDSIVTLRNPNGQVHVLTGITERNQQTFEEEILTDGDLIHSSKSFGYKNEKIIKNIGYKNSEHYYLGKLVANTYIVENANYVAVNSRLSGSTIQTKLYTNIKDITEIEALIEEINKEVKQYKPKTKTLKNPN